MEIARPLEARADSSAPSCTKDVTCVVAIVTMSVRLTAPRTRFPKRRADDATTNVGAYMTRMYP